MKSDELESEKDVYVLRHTKYTLNHWKIKVAMFVDFLADSILQRT